MMEKQDANSTCINEIYLGPEVFTELSEISDLGVMFSNLLSHSEVLKCYRYLNALSLKDRMYPKTQLSPLAYCNMDEIRCVIVGGMPIRDMLPHWTGAGYSYSKPMTVTNLHEKILADTSFHPYHPKCVDSEFKGLQNAGVLMLHDVLSVSEKYYDECRKLWRPIVSRLLFEISKECPNVPIIFTTTMSNASFRESVRNSSYVFSLRGIGNAKFSEEIKIFKFVEELINAGLPIPERIDFTELIEDEYR